MITHQLRQRQARKRIDATIIQGGILLGHSHRSAILSSHADSMLLQTLR
ncbi:hypothetical protein IG612_12155 [Pectobacterium sp. FL60-S17]|uniref:Uncharacterized protein n=1 Tax=Pectobacterium quasiaquaticum TaxID=2774015 RepID=A0A9Q2EY24_9GAMM|nr:hypothetical protein [Pectobacterium quasiaquaticum]MBE5203348.1 hypothetical protein [Pectobacterium quasiaquaticum]MBE5208714.1 hypothetical protein [Pectobacterium quasiaquaticum]MBE5215275.1 hypothetical protein [Pectobacterium quasiaquaticum]MBE5221124.1 hypothetical protein [Pectobacterium quasiaquaticum]MBE5225055.1 hypothetical protein [Pectobacterium quasiaquaticum]